MWLTAATTAAPSVQPSVVLGVVIALFLVVAAVVVWLGGVERWTAVAGAGVRAAVQLAVVSLVIGFVVGSWLLTAAFTVVMFTVAVRTAGRRMTSGRGWWWAGLPISIGVVPMVAILLVSAAIPLVPLTFVPVVGQLIGGAMTASGLAGKRCGDELRQRHGEVEAALSLGLPDRDARILIARRRAGDALLPAIDQTRTVGTVTLPGAFVGMLLGGATPLQAGVVQLYVLIALLAVESLAVVIVLELVCRGRIARTG